VADELDELLVRGLASYTTEPLAGLEERVLTRVRGVGIQRRAAVWGWAAGVLAMVCLVMVFFRLQVRDVGVPTRTETAPPPVQVKAAEPPWSHLSRAANGHLVTGVLAGHRRVRRVTAIQHLSREEVLLARFVAADPEGAAKEFASLNESVQRDVTVEPLVVEPIKIESLQ